MSKRIPFRVQSHVLKLLGDELIGHDRLAVFELVKNAYDADATDVVVKLALGTVPGVNYPELSASTILSGAAGR